MMLMMMNDVDDDDDDDDVDDVDVDEGNHTDLTVMSHFRQFQPIS